MPDLVGGLGGMAVCAQAGLTECVRRDPGPGRRAFPAGPLRGVGSRRPALPSGQPDPGDHVADPHRLVDRARRAGHGSLARPGDALADPPAHPDGLGRRAHPAAHGALCERHGRAGDELRAVVRLPPHQRHLGVLGAGLRRSHRAGDEEPRLPPHPAADHQPANRPGGSRSAGPYPPDRGRQRVRRAELVQASRAADLRRSRRQDVEDQRMLAPVDQRRRLPRPSMALVPAAQRVDAEGVDLLPDRRAAGGADDVAARNAARRTQLGLPLCLGARLHLCVVGALHPGPGPRSRRLLRVHRRRVRRQQR